MFILTILIEVAVSQLLSWRNEWKVNEDKVFSVEYNVMEKTDKWVGEVWRLKKLKN